MVGGGDSGVSSVVKLVSLDGFIDSDMLWALMVMSVRR